MDVDARLRPYTSVYVRLRRVHHPMASDVVARDMFMNDVNITKKCLRRLKNQLRIAIPICKTIFLSYS